MFGLPSREILPQQTAAGRQWPGQWGWYPKGGGQIIAVISPASALYPTKRWERREVNEIHILSAQSNLSMSIGKRQKDQVIRRLDAYGLEITQTELVDAPSAGTGTMVFLMPRFGKGTAGFTSLGKKGKRAEKVADEACSEFFRFVGSNAAVDEHLADQLIQVHINIV